MAHTLPTTSAEALEMKKLSAMKKSIATGICLVALIAGSGWPAAAQLRNRRTYQERRYSQRYDDCAQDRDWDEYYNRDRSVWDKHRDKITTAGGAVGGAIIGGLI